MVKHDIWAARLVGAALLLGAGPGFGQVPFSNLDACGSGAFSVEEDFLTRGPEPQDGNPLISDGDVLSPGGTVCVRNAELMRVFDIRPDLGLDALDIVGFAPQLIAFSTELDSPHGQFTAGDLLLTDGVGHAVIPNAVLLAPFGVAHDIGLDEVKFIGSPERVRRFVRLALRTPAEAWTERSLAETLKESGVDIWFSVEGTVRERERALLDGDILAASGTVVATNRDLLVPGAPAGLPKEGVDFGVDAFVAAGEAIAAARVAGAVYFSTEILHAADVSFTDGDLLAVGGTVVATNGALVAAFEPAAEFLGLDAVWFPLPAGGEPRITTMCDRSVGQFDGGIVPIGGDGTGLHQTPLASPPALLDVQERACGRHVPVDGALPVPPTDVKRFRVAYREHTAPPPATAGDPLTAAIETAWRVFGPTLSFIPGDGWQIVCEVPVTLATSGGWMDAATYIDAKNGIGTFAGCPHAEMRLAVWNTAALPAGAPDGSPIDGIDDREDHYVLWLEWEDSGGVMHREPVEHHLQLDNTLPLIAAYPDGLQLRSGGDADPILACDETPVGASDLQVWARFQDRHYDRFELRLEGGEPPAARGYGPHRHFDPIDGTAGIKNTDATGTLPDLTTVRLRDIAMTDLGGSFTECCYGLTLRVWDRAIRHSFDGSIVNEISDTVWSRAFMTFAAEP